MFRDFIEDKVNLQIITHQYKKPSELLTKHLNTYYLTIYKKILRYSQASKKNIHIKRVLYQEQNSTRLK